MNQALSFDEAVLSFDQAIEIKAAPGDVFEGMLHRLTEGHRGGPMGVLPLKLERWPGGRWFRDLGSNRGHLWGFVQSIKPPSLLELHGPMFMSYPVMNHMILRFEPVPEGTRVAFQFSAFGLLQDDHREGLRKGFAGMLKDVRERLEQ
jgi:hypothetical protein